MEVEIKARSIPYICETHEVISILPERLSPPVPNVKGRSQSGHRTIGGDALLSCEWLLSIGYCQRAPSDLDEASHTQYMYIRRPLPPTS